MEDQSLSDVVSDSEWEYEVDLNNKESFYITLDTSHNPNNVFKQKADKPANGAYARKGGTSIVGTAHAGDEQLDADIVGVDKASIQILDLPSQNPIISYGSQLYSCNWSQGIGTDLIFCQAPRYGEETTHATGLQSKESQITPLPVDPVLQGSGWALLATTSTKLVGHACKAIPKEKSDTARYTEIARAKSAMKAIPAIQLPDLFPDGGDRAKADRQGPIPSKVTLENEASARPVKIPLGITATYSKQAQGKFLERFIAAKQSRGEQDHVFIGQGRSYEDCWRDNGDADSFTNKSKDKAARVSARSAQVYEASDRQTRSNTLKGVAPQAVAIGSSGTTPQEFQDSAPDAIERSSTKGPLDISQEVLHRDQNTKSTQHQTTSTNIPSRNSQSIVDIPSSSKGNVSTPFNDAASLQNISNPRDVSPACTGYNAASNDNNNNNAESHLQRPVQTPPSQPEHQLAADTVPNLSLASGNAPSSQNSGEAAAIQLPPYVSPYRAKHLPESAMGDVAAPISTATTSSNIPSSPRFSSVTESDSIKPKLNSNASEKPAQTSGKRTWGGRRPRAGRPTKDSYRLLTNTANSPSLEDPNEPRGMKRKQHAARGFHDEGGDDDEYREASEGGPVEEQSRRGRPRSKWLATEDKETLSRTEVLVGGLFRDMVPLSAVKGPGNNGRAGKKDDGG